MATMTASSGFICELSGELRDPQYHRCRILLQELSVISPEFMPKLHGVVERDFLDHLRSHAAIINNAHPADNLRTTRLVQQHTDPYILVNQRVFLAGEEELLAFAIEHTRLSRSELLVATAFGAAAIHNHNHTAVDAEERIQEKAEAAAREALFRHRQVTGNDVAYLLFEIDGVTLPYVEIELFHRVCPKTCANFLALCQNMVPDIADEVNMLGYKNTLVHRIVPGAWIQAGDVTGSRGDGPARSLYGREFPDESFVIAHDTVGIVSMANAGRPHTNGSQFFITLAPLPRLDRKNVAFGRVVAGFTTLQRLAQQETTNERPCVPCRIVDAGKIVD